ncbi:hypothetical protein Q9L58_010137 [Maublancomyces gigas]|uniref:Uncharacterized protein n=1 Tax=Discina gigas TaxID=1032678 RepID=A0ABR3G519_9PEZI
MNTLETAPSTPPPPPPAPPAASPSRSNAAVNSKARGPSPKNPTKQNVDKLVNTETCRLQSRLVVTYNPTAPNTLSNNGILTSVNNRLNTTSVRFLLAAQFLEGNLVLMTSPANTAIEALTTTAALTSNLQAPRCHLRSILATIIWSSFLVHNLPTFSTSKEIATDIQLSNITNPLCRHARWVTTADKRKEKTHSTMVITLLRHLTLSNLRLTSLEIPKQVCKLTMYTPNP